jgi:hypothetical protein
MVGILSTGERTVTQLAEALQLTEPTISHHVAKLHSAGLLHLRMVGNQRLYRLNHQRLERFKAYAADIGRLGAEQSVKKSDNAWIDALDWSDADKKILRDNTLNGRLPQFPAKDKKWVVILRWLATKFQPGVRYTEKQVNAILGEVNEDYATMRRDLVEYGFMRRERGGGDYWLTPENEPIL